MAFALLAPLALLALLAGAQDIGDTLRFRLSTVLPVRPCVRLFQYAGSGATGTAAGLAHGDAGCSTGSAGVQGVLVSAESQADVDALVSSGGGWVTAGGSPPSASASADRAFVVLPPALLTLANLRSLQQIGGGGGGGWLAGVVSLPGPFGGPGEGFSPAAPFPSPAPASPRAWNPTGRDLLSQRFPFPIIAAADAATADDVLSRARANNGDPAASASSPVSGGRGRAKHAIFAYYPMGDGPASGGFPTDTPSCLAQGACLPLGGESVWATLGPLDASSSSSSSSPSLPRPIILAVAALDATALFHDLAFGADAAASAIVALVAAADALGREPSAFALPIQPAFALFQGDAAWGRLGSRRWLSEVSSFVCAQQPSAPSPTLSPASFCAYPPRADLAFANLSATPLAGVIAVDQVGHPGLQRLFVHPGQGMGSSTPSSNPIAAVMGALAAAGLAPLPVGPSSGAGAVRPPTSLDSWDDIGWPGPVRPAAWFGGLEGSGFATAVLAGYDAAYASAFYGSRFDNASNVDDLAGGAGGSAGGGGAVAKTATLLARALFALATNVSVPAASAALVPATLEANATLVYELLGCLALDAACPLFASLLGTDVATLASLTGTGTGAPTAAGGGTSPSPTTSPTTLYPGVYTAPQLYQDGSGLAIYPSIMEAALRNALALAVAGPPGGPSTGPGTCGVAASSVESGGRAGWGAGSAVARAAAAAAATSAQQGKEKETGSGRAAALPRARSSRLSIRAPALPPAWAPARSAGQQQQEEGGRAAAEEEAADDPSSSPCAYPFECISGRCILASSLAHYHEAYSLAVEPSSDGAWGSFVFNDTLAASGAFFPARAGAGGDPVWAEPYWSAGIGASVYLREDAGTEAAMAAVGVLVTVAAGLAAWRLGAHLDSAWGSRAA